MNEKEIRQYCLENIKEFNYKEAYPFPYMHSGGITWNKEVQKFDPVVALKQAQDKVSEFERYTNLLSLLETEEFISYDNWLFIRKFIYHPDSSSVLFNSFTSPEISPYNGYRSSQYILDKANSAFIESKKQAEKVEKYEDFNRSFNDLMKTF